ncbi:MAG: DUF2975 domain-containing protein [Oscillospiraceae bacterium]|nr:DUF2975 domain-containing protein [Oscillospiraceae bacterium]
MWNDKKSILLSKICVILFMAALVFCAATAPGSYWLWLRIIPPQYRAYFLATIYTGCVPAALLLIMLYALLHRISEGEIFVERNTDCLRRISWCCFAGAAVSFASSLYWFSWFAIGVAAAFMGLIVRVIKNVVAKAVLLKDDADYTI